MEIEKIARAVKLVKPVPSDIEVSQSVTPHPIPTVAETCGILPEEFEPLGKFKGKVSLSILDRLSDKKDGKYVLVTGMTPTPYGEGKSTTTLGLAQSLGAHLHKEVFANVRQPSMGPIFGIKGGAAGGGFAQVIPMEDFNIGLPDINSVAAANNLLAAAIDTRMFHESTQKDEALFRRLCPVQKDGTLKLCPVMKKRLVKLGINKDRAEDLTSEEISKFVRLDIDPSTITWQRVVDINDRSLRGITIGEGEMERGRTRSTGFDIAVASEVMAVLALSTDLMDLRNRLGRIVIGYSKGGETVTAEDIGAAGAMTVLLKDAIMPNLMQSVEGTPVFVHCGPFANIAHGNSSVVSDRIALKLVGEDGYVLTEAGFGADIGMEKFFDIKTRVSGLSPRAVVLVSTVRAVKHHGDGDIVLGCENVKRHVENANKYGVPLIVCVNRFSSDTEEEVEIVRKAALEAGAFAAVESNHWEEGGLGAVNLAKSVIEACDIPSDMKLLYPLEMGLKEKIVTIATEIYRADGVDFSPEVEKRIEVFEKSGFGGLPICMAKTPLSFTADPSVKNAPVGFRIHVRDIRASVGAGFVFPLLGKMMTMPGLATRPAYYDIDINFDTGKIEGMF